MKNLFINLLIKLGLLKIDQTKYFDMLVKLHKDLPEMMLKNKNLNNEEHNNALCEIKIFLWIIASPIFEENVPFELFDKTMKFYRSNIIFSTIDEHQYSEEYISNLLIARLDFHQNGIQGTGFSSITDNYFQQLKVVLFEQPFIDITELSKKNKYNLDIFNKVMGQAEGQLLYKHIVPGYVESLKKLIKMTKK
jgi:hypothetical protein